MDLKGKRVLVMGLGLHGGGLGVTRWLLGQGAIVRVTDLKNRVELESTLAALGDAPVELVLGEHREGDFTAADLIVRNPGVPRESRYLHLARERGIPIRMEMGLFFEQLPAGMDQVIGITGTKGKSTTTMMVGEILKRENEKTLVAGNLRVSALELLDRIDADTPVVLELSSFQLEEFEELAFSPRIAAITNIYPDHLNRYSGMDEYVSAKTNLFRHQRSSDYCILNFDNPVLTRLRPLVPSQVVWFSRRRALNDGAFLDGEMLTRRSSGVKEAVIQTVELGAPGEHNVENALAAIAIAGAWGAAAESMAVALREFKGAAHRQQVLGVVNGVTYVNDTTATAPTAAILALRSWSAAERQVWLICGGSDKALDYTSMGEAICELRPGVLLLDGTATGKLEAAITAAGCRSLVAGHFSSLEDAVEEAGKRARSGDVILLSPGAASFGMFANEFERGDRFREIVNGLFS